MEWTKKKIRLALGLIMYGSFIYLVVGINFMITIGLRLAENYNPGIVILVLLTNLSFAFLPSIMLIILTYVLLTKVYKYEKKEK